MPLVIHLIYFVRALLPVSTFDAVADWFGVLDTMDDFKGRKKTE